MLVARSMMIASTRPITTNITRVGQPVRSRAKRLANQMMTGVTGM